MCDGLCNSIMTQAIAISQCPFVQCSILTCHLPNTNTLADLSRTCLVWNTCDFLITHETHVRVAGIHTQQLLKTTPSHTILHHSTINAHSFPPSPNTFLPSGNSTRVPKSLISETLHAMLTTCSLAYANFVLRVMWWNKDHFPFFCITEEADCCDFPMQLWLHFHFLFHFLFAQCTMIHLFSCVQIMFLTKQLKWI